MDRDHTQARYRAPLHARLPSAHERQGRALHPDAALRVGLRAQLSLQRRPFSSAWRVPTLVQQTPPAQLARGTTTDQPRLTPLWSGQLVLAHQRAELGELLAAELVALAALDPLEHVLHERRELERVERLRHVVDPAEVEPARAVAKLRPGREEDDRDRARRVV